MELRNPRTGSDPIDHRHPPPARTPLEVAAEVALVPPHAAAMVTRLMIDPRVSFRSKVFAAAVGCYVLSPIDLLPDRIPGIGHLDDVLLASLAVDALLASAGDEIVESVWAGSEDALDLLRSFVGWNADLVRSMVPFLRVHGRPPVH